MNNIYKNINTLTKAQLERLEKEKKQALDNEYQKLVFQYLSEAIDTLIDTLGNISLAEKKLIILNKEYDIIEKEATRINNVKIKHEYTNTNNLNTLSDYELVNKYGKNYTEIANDLEKNFIDVLNTRFKNLELKEKLEKEVEKEKAKSIYNQVYEYLDYIIKKTKGTTKTTLTSINTEKIKKVVASDLMLNYDNEYIQAYNKAFKNLKDKYKGNIEYEKETQANDNKPLSIWWKIVIARKTLKALLKQ